MADDDAAAGSGLRETRLPPPGQKWARVIHVREKGGCGADITEHCTAFRLVIPVLTTQGMANMTQVVRIMDMLCPACGDPIFHEPDEHAAVQVARSLPPM
jgi:hypothetical protein